MKKIIKITTLLTTLGVLFTSCKKFEEINNDPLAANVKSKRNQKINKLK